MKMYEYKIGEFTENEDESFVTGVENLEQYKKLSKEIKRLNNAFTKAVVETSLKNLKENAVEEKKKQNKLIELLDMYEFGSREYNCLLDVWEVLFNENNNR